MGSFGERLRREREMRGVTLDEISNSTKIARRHLDALESEDFDSLPGGIFNRGFVRAYAHFLGIDEEQAVADFMAASGEESKPEPSFPIEVQPQPRPKLNPRRSSLPLLLALLALVVVLAIFWARKSRPDVVEIPPSTATPTSSPTAEPVASASVEPPAAQSTPGSETATVSTSSATASETSEPAGSQTATPLQSPERTFSVMVKAKEEAWINVTVDGKEIVSNKTLQAGQQQVIRAGKRIVLITGNAGGIDITFNGRPLGPIGSESERRELTFTPAGLVQ